MTVTIKNQDTGQTRTVLTESGGTYRAPGLSLGPYEVRAELEGFQPMLRKGITLTVGREAQVNFKLTLARMSEAIVVQAEAPLVNTTESTISHLVDDRKFASCLSPRCKERGGGDVVTSLACPERSSDSPH